MELSKVEQRYEAVLAVIRDGLTVTEVAKAFGVGRQTVHVWLARYEEGGLAALGDRSHRPRTSPLQIHHGSKPESWSFGVSIRPRAQLGSAINSVGGGFVLSRRSQASTEPWSVTS